MYNRITAPFIWKGADGLPAPTDLGVAIILIVSFIALLFLFGIA